jgi:hypothetical protein
MKDKPINTSQATEKIFHLPKARQQKSIKEEVLQEVELSLASHFREQNEILLESNRDLSEKMQRLTTGIEHLVAEMHGVRTGRKEEAFARIGSVGASPDLPTVSGEAALIYIYTAGQIGEQLGFHCSQIGLLLSARGLGWVGNGDYQEIGRTTSQSQSKFWHMEVPDRLRKILDEGNPTKYGITTKAVLTMFRKWKERSINHELLDALPTTEAPH